VWGGDQTSGRFYAPVIEVKRQTGDAQLRYLSLLSYPSRGSLEPGLAAAKGNPSCDELTIIKDSDHRRRGP
jgi:hypothetical protein